MTTITPFATSHAGSYFGCLPGDEAATVDPDHHRQARPRGVGGDEHVQVEAILVDALLSEQRRSLGTRASEGGHVADRAPPRMELWRLPAQGTHRGAA